MMAMISIRLAAAALGTCFFAAPVLAQEIECHNNKDYLVVSKTYSGDAGAQFAITALNGKPKPAKCAFDAKKADFVIGKPGDPLWFSAQTGSLLILTRSTGPQGDMVVYDLKTRKSVLDVPSDDYAAEGGKLVFWQRTAAATKKNCPSFTENEKNGMVR